MAKIVGAPTIAIDVVVNAALRKAGLRVTVERAEFLYGPRSDVQLKVAATCGNGNVGAPTI